MSCFFPKEREKNTKSEIPRSLLGREFQAPQDDQLHFLRSNLVIHNQKGISEAKGKKWIPPRECAQILSFTFLRPAEFLKPFEEDDNFSRSVFVLLLFAFEFRSEEDGGTAAAWFRGLMLMAARTSMISAASRIPATSMPS
jgi:hypothetical protein